MDCVLVYFVISVQHSNDHVLNKLQEQDLLISTAAEHIDQRQSKHQGGLSLPAQLEAVLPEPGRSPGASLGLVVLVALAQATGGLAWGTGGYTRATTAQERAGK